MYGFFHDFMNAALPWMALGVAAAVVIKFSNVKKGEDESEK